MNTHHRAAIRKTLAALALMCCTSLALAQGYPNKPVKIITGFPAGSPDDFIARLVAEGFQEEFKQPMIVENRSGAGGNLAAQAVATSAPDGYTLLATVDTTVTLNPHIYKKLQIKPDRDLVPVMFMARPVGQTLVCNPSLSVTDVAGLVKLAKSQTLTYASGGIGTPGHLSAEMFQSITGVKMSHVPYRGPLPALQDILSGQVPCGFLATASVTPIVKDGRLKALGVGGLTRSVVAPQLPTLAESGVPGFDAAFGQILLAPAGAPPSVLRFLNENITKILQRPDVRARMLGVDLDFVPNSPDQAMAELHEESARWKQLTDRLRLQVD